MDELKTAWNNLKESKDNFSATTELELQDAMRNKSKGPIQKIKKQVFIKLFMCVFIILLFAIYLPFASPFISQVLLVFILIGYTIGSVLLFKEYRSLSNSLDMSENLLKGLKNYRKKIAQIIKYEEIIGLILYPISGPAGFFVGLKLQNEDTPLLEDKVQWITLVLIIVILTPVGHFLTKWMNKKAFDKYIDQIDDNIRILELN